MSSKRIKQRSKKARPTLQAAFAFAQVVVEASRRGLGLPSGPRQEAGLESACGQIFVLLGRNLERHLRQMVAADDRYQEERVRQHRRRLRRDAITKRGHTLLVDSRKYLQGLFGRENACWVLGRLGPSQREPRALHLQLGEAIWWARNWEFPPEPLRSGGEVEAEKCVVRLEKLYTELDQVMDEIDHGHRKVESAMLYQREAMAAFDRAYKYGARVIEAQLIQVGLPTLADAVRPGVGRRGRPLKQRPVDLYPDLVEQVRVEGQIELDLAESKEAPSGAEALATSSKQAGDDAARDLALRDGAGDGSEAELVVSTEARDGSAGAEKSQHPVHKRSVDEEIIEQRLHKRCESDEKSQHLFHKGSETDEKSEQRFHKRAGADEKSEQRLHNLPAGEASGLFSRFTQSSLVVACNQDPRKRDLRRRTGGPAGGRRSRERVQPAQASWWRRLLRVA